MSSFMVKLEPPKLKEGKKYESYKQELLLWNDLTDVPEEKRAGVVAFSLPEDTSDCRIRSKVFETLELKNLGTTSGLEKLIDFLDKQFLLDGIEDAWLKYEEFEGFERKADMAMNSFISEFDGKYNRMEKCVGASTTPTVKVQDTSKSGDPSKIIFESSMKLPAPILAFRLLKAAKISAQERMLVLTAVNFEEKISLYEQMKKALLKFKDSAIIKSDLNSPDQSDVMYSAGGAGHKRGSGRQWYGNGNFRGQSRGGIRPPMNPGPSNWRGRGNSNFRGNAKIPDRRANRLGYDGKPLKCHICESTMHLIEDCPHKWEHAKITYHLTENEEEAYIMNTGRATKDLFGMAILDSACSATVCGKIWFQDFMDCLEEEDQNRVVKCSEEKIFKFGGGETLPSIGAYNIPVYVDGGRLLVHTDVVQSDIPLLLSKTTMKKLGVVMDLENDCASILGKDISLDISSSGHYCIPIRKPKSVEDVFAVRALDTMDNENKVRAIWKLHRQFAHPSFDRFKNLLKDAGAYCHEYDPILRKIHLECDVCKMFSKTPPRPAVCMPLANHFNQKVAMDLKKWDGKWILHMVDVWSRFTISRFIGRKRPADVVDAIVTAWIGQGFGVMESILTDNGGEFSADEVREVCSVLNIEVHTTAAYSPFQNGIVERNHCIVDDMLLKLREQCPQTPIDVLLAWAINAKNSLQMHHGYSSYQLVFGKNPNLPNFMTARKPGLDGVAISSDTLRTHLDALHKARQAFIESESSERIRRALNAKIRACEEKFETGDKVYYKREGKDKWLGPGKVLFQDGRVVFVRHGGILVRVSPNRLLKKMSRCPSPSQKILETTQTKSLSRGNEFENDVRIHEEQTDDLGEIGMARNSCNEPVDVPENASDAVTSVDKTSNAPVLDESTSENPERHEQMDDEQNVDGSEHRQTPESTETGGDVSRKSSLRNTVRQDYAKLHRVGKTAETLISTSARVDMDPDECEMAMKKELENWKKFDVYSEVDDDGEMGKAAISTRWVLTEKGDGKSKTVKARLVARGFEEKDDIQSDSPTAMKETIRLILAITATMKWYCNSIDIKAAFLQGQPMERTVYLKPPANMRTPGKLWKLKKAVYGLGDASRTWYFSVRKTLKNLGCSQSKLDPSLFFAQNGSNLEGVIVIHVDDFLWSGTTDFKLRIIDGICKKFDVGKEEHGIFRYIGLEIQHDNDGILLDQKTYVADVSPIAVKIEGCRRRQDPISESETSLLRKAVGQLNWVGTQTRPDLSFDILDLSTEMTRGKVEDLERANKAVRTLKSECSQIRFPNLGRMENLRLVVFSDAAFANLRDGHSSTAGYLVFLVGQNERCCLLTWKSCRIRRVVKSTLASETLALVEALDDACFLRKILSELGVGTPHGPPIESFVDNRSLVENVRSTKSVSEKKLRIDIAAIKEMLERGELKSVSWVESKAQLADALTKRGVSSQNLKKIIVSGRHDF